MEDKGGTNCGKDKGQALLQCANGGRTWRGKNQSKMLNSNDLKYTKEI
jgi:hypothetical protein